MIEKIVFKNSLGAEITLTNTLPFMFSNLEGLGSEPVQLQTTKSFAQDGNDYHGTLSEARIIKFKVTISGDTITQHETNRMRFLSIFAPKLETGLLTFYKSDNSNDAYIIYAEVFDGPTDILMNDYFSEYEVALSCHYPYFQSLIQYSKKLIGFEGGLTFPITFPISFANQGSTAVINCESPLPTPLLIVFSGEAENPKLEKLNTGEYIQINKTLLSDDILKIDTTPNKVVVTVNDEDAFDYVAIANTYFLLSPGSNTLRFSATAGSPQAFIYWRNSYSGI